MLYKFNIRKYDHLIVIQLKLINTIENILTNTNRTLSCAVEKKIQMFLN